MGVQFNLTHVASNNLQCNAHLDGKKTRLEGNSGEESSDYAIIFGIYSPAFGEQVFSLLRYNIGLLLTTHCVSFCVYFTLRQC